VRRAPQAAGQKLVAGDVVERLEEARHLAVELQQLGQRHVLLGLGVLGFALALVEQLERRPELAQGRADAVGHHPGVDQHPGLTRLEGEARVGHGVVGPLAEMAQRPGAPRQPRIPLEGLPARPLADAAVEDGLELEQRLAHLRHPLLALQAHLAVELQLAGVAVVGADELVLDLYQYQIALGGKPKLTDLSTPSVCGRDSQGDPSDRVARFFASDLESAAPGGLLSASAARQARHFFFVLFGTDGDGRGSTASYPCHRRGDGTGPSLHPSTLVAMRRISEESRFRGELTSFSCRFGRVDRRPFAAAAACHARGTHSRSA
jgi:hypothetical protein